MAVLAVLAAIMHSEVRAGGGPTKEPIEGPVKGLVRVPVKVVTNKETGTRSTEEVIGALAG